MQYHDQLITHAPEHGVYGDCFRTCIACLLDLHPREVPHFFQADYTAPQNEIDRCWDMAQEWLSGRGLTMFSVAFAGNLEDLLNTMRVQNPGIYYLLGGSSGTANHQVVALDDKIVHDPNPKKPGLVGPSSDGYFWINLLLPAWHKEA